MTGIEQKALALVNKVLAERPFGPNDNYIYVTLCRAIEQHEAFRQEVSDRIEACRAAWPGSWAQFSDTLDRFIISKPDLLVEALDEALWEVSNVKLTDRELRAVSLRLNAKRGGEIEGEKQ